MLQRIQLTIFFMLFFFGQQMVQAQNNVDVRVTENLNKLEFKYDIKEDGTFQFTVPVNSRSQIIYVHSKTYSYAQLEIREVFALIYSGPQRPNEAVLNKLLSDNAQKKLGAWELLFEGNNYFIVFTAKVPANQNEADLKSTIDIVSTSADAMEQILFNTDEW